MRTFRLAARSRGLPPVFGAEMTPTPPEEVAGEHVTLERMRTELEKEANDREGGET